MYVWAFLWVFFGFGCLFFFVPQMCSVGPQQSYTKEQRLSVFTADPMPNTV